MPAEPAVTADALLRKAVDQLAAAGIGEANLDARLLLQAATGLDRAGLMRDPDALVGAEAQVRLAALIARRAAGEPVSRILGQKGFWSLDLLVTADVLDPRPDTETLIEAAIVALAGRLREPLRVLDLGTGSGALLCAMLVELPNARGIGVDLSADAVELARRNLQGCGLSARAEIVVGSWFEPVSGRFDLILSNPPYIPSSDIAGLDREVRDHDPRLALDGGADGLDAYRILAQGLPDHLKPDGLAILEFGAGQDSDVAKLMTAAGLKVRAFRRDLGGHVRAILVGLG